MAASIKDVAKEAGVSIATVSRVLNNIDVVNYDTKQKVLEAIKKLDYTPNVVARSLKTQKTSTLGIIIPDISSQFYPEVVRGAEDVANIYNYNVILCNTDLDKQKEIEYLRVLKEKMVDGILYMSSSIEPEIFKYIQHINVPIVLVENVDKDDTFPSVTINNLDAAYEAVKYLIKKGNKKIGYIGHKDLENNATAKRFLGYKKALEESNIKLNEKITYFGGLKVEDGYKGALEIIKHGDIDAIFCSSDECAMGAINALREKNINVPNDVDIMGFNDIYEASVFYPKLTTVSIPMYDMGSVGMRMLIKIVNKEELKFTHYVLPYEIVERQSCKM